MTTKRKICVLGSTGTIGSFTLDLVRKFPDQFQVLSLAAGQNLTKLVEQIREFQPETVSVLNAPDARFLEKEFPKLKVGFGEKGIEECIDVEGVHTVIVGIVGFAGLKPTLHAIQRGKWIGLANKESLVTAGSLLQEEIQKKKSVVVPVDSEHNALFQLLKSVDQAEVETLVLTASGGPFLRKTDLDLSRVTPEMAIAHPNWKMGPKISVDSATLMNKGLELIEAHYLFGFPEDKIEVWVHPQSIIHGAIWLRDNTSLAQLSVPDMRSAIGYALSYPKRLLHSVPKLSFSQMAQLEFLEPDTQRFPCLSLARKALKMGQSHVIALNAANEIAVSAFLNGQLKFTQISEKIDATLQSFPGTSIQDLEGVFAADKRAREIAEKLLGAASPL